MDEDTASQRGEDQLKAQEDGREAETMDGGFRAETMHFLSVGGRCDVSLHPERI
jgi:hypothetical protein